MTIRADDVIRGAAEKIANDARSERLHVRGLEGLHIDPRVAAVELTDEERALRASRPTGRKWRALDRLDDEADRLTAKLAEAGTRLQAAEEALRQAPQDDARSLAEWIAAGEKGERPAASVYERERDRDAAELLVNAVRLELDGALRRRVDHVERHREKLTREAQDAVNTAHANYAAALAALTEARSELVDARALTRWVTGFPGPEANTDPLLTAQLAGGLRKPVKTTLGTEAQVPFASVVAALAADADTLCADWTPAERDPGDIRQTAQWTQTPEGDKALTDEKKRILEALTPRHTTAAGWLED